MASSSIDNFFAFLLLKAIFEPRSVVCAELANEDYFLLLVLFKDGEDALDLKVGELVRFMTWMVY